MALISECTALARSWILEKGFPAKADLIFGKSQKAHGANSGECGGCSIQLIPLSCDQGTSVWCELCEELHILSSVMQLDSRPTGSSPCRWLNMQKNFWQNWSCVICGSDYSFVGRYVDSNKPVSIKEICEHSLSWTETCSQDLRAWFIFGQPHHVRTFTFHNEEREIQHSSTVTTSETS